MEGQCDGGAVRWRAVQSAMEGQSDEGAVRGMAVRWEGRVRWRGSQMEGQRATEGQWRGAGAMERMANWTECRSAVCNGGAVRWRGR